MNRFFPSIVSAHPSFYQALVTEKRSKLFTFLLKYLQNKKGRVIYLFGKKIRLLK